MRSDHRWSRCADLSFLCSDVIFRYLIIYTVIVRGIPANAFILIYNLLIYQPTVDI